MLEFQVILNTLTGTAFSNHLFRLTLHGISENSSILTKKNMFVPSMDRFKSGGILSVKCSRFAIKISEATINIIV